jgi:hypothetical protein
MTDQNEPTPQADEWMSRFVQTEKLRAELWPVNKQAILAALKDAEINSVMVTFDGYGDSGQIENIEVQGAKEGQALPSVQIAWQDPDWETGAGVPSTIPLHVAIENAVYAALEKTHAGWENNSGAFGEFKFDVAEATVTLDYSERFESSDFYQHTL